MPLSNQDLAILLAVAGAGGAYLYMNKSKATPQLAAGGAVNGGAVKVEVDAGTGRDFVAAMEKAVRTSPLLLRPDDS
jgi:hypothetical protein